MARIELRDIDLTFRVRKHGRPGLKEFIVRSLRRQYANPCVEVQALKKINLTIEAGQRLGVIGPNGSGKSTLLRLIAGVYPPSAGTRRVDGEIHSLMDIGLGIEPNARGEDNIAYRCYLQGDTPAQVEAKRRGIAEFSGLGDFLHLPIRYYSSGMYVRFAFAVATAIDPEILLLDEVFGAGDLAFQEKARRRMLELVDRAHLMVFVSHDLVLIRQFCNRVIWMNEGKIIADGDTQTVIARYKQHMSGGEAPDSLHGHALGQVPGLVDVAAA